jgi:uncharacterized protein (TIGR02271 family)
MAHPLTPSESLRRLRDAEYDVAPGEPDVRGWHVVAANAERIGTVDDLIIDPEAGKVRYLEVGVDRHVFTLDRDRRVLIPIGSAQLDTNDKLVVLSGMTRDAIAKLPDFTGNFDRHYDETYRGYLSNAYPATRMTRSAEELRIGRRLEKTGDVRVAKHVETEHVRHDVPVRQEQVHIERRPVDRAAGAAPEFRNQETIVPVMEEEAVIEKRPVVKEEIVISKAPVTKQKTVETDLRHEEVEIGRSSPGVQVTEDNKKRGGR